MKWIIRASDKSYRAAIAHEANEGRLPIARLTFGFVTGHGWGFVHPWEQKALFPAKGTINSFNHPRSKHERFIIWRVWPTDWLMEFKHPNHGYYIAGRYWWGWVWRESWGYRLWFWPRFRWALLDPDIVTNDPGKADDWGEGDGEDW